MNFKINIDNRKILKKEYIILVMEISALNKLKNKNLITEEVYKKSMVQIQEFAHL